jgi:hypothetical protein
MAFLFSLITLSEEMDTHLREIEKLSRRYEVVLYPDERDEIEKAIDLHLKEVLKHKDKVLKKMDREIRKVEKRAAKLEKKIAGAERRKRDAGGLRKELTRAIEGIDVLKSDAVEHIPQSLLSLAFIDGSLQTGGEYFSIDMRNFIGDLYFVGAPRRRRYDRIKIRSAELYTNGERCNNFDVICGGKSYDPYAIEGLNLRVKKGDIATLRVYTAFSEGMKLRLVMDTENFGPLSFEKSLKTAR